MELWRAGLSAFVDRPITGWGVGRYRTLGRTLDDAAGEAFDKVAKLLGLGYPGGPIIDKLAAQGDGSSHAFPRALMAKDSLEFSFSGLKTAMAVYLDKHGQPQTRQALADLCAAYQDAIVDTLLIKVRRALLQSGHRRFHLVGGVAANMRLRGRVSELADVLDHPVAVPALKYCGDNAAMIGAAAAGRMRAGIAPSLEVHTNRALDEFPLACNEAQMPSQGSQR